MGASGVDLLSKEMRDWPGALRYIDGVNLYRCDDCPESIQTNADALAHYRTWWTTWLASDRREWIVACLSAPAAPS